jgi:ADP-heptose:LPS heptosyltransferase
MTQVIRFDGESSLRSVRTQDIVFKRFGVRIHARPGYKQLLAERMIKEVKLRVSVALHLQGNLKNFLMCVSTSINYFFYLGLKLNAWKQVLNHSVNSINYNKIAYKSKLGLLKDFFTKPPVVIPQSIKNIYRFSVGEKVYVDLTPIQRKNIGFKWSLNPVCAPLFLMFTVIYTEKKS